MANGNKYQTFSQIDYCISQYYSKYMAPSIVQEQKVIEKNQGKEFMDALEKENNRPLLAQAMDAMHGSNVVFRAKMIADATGKWSKMTMDDLVYRCQQKWFNDKKFQNDYSVFVTAFYGNLVAQNGGKPSEKLFRYAESYVQHRFETLVVEQLARQKVPKNTAEYIAKRAFSGSLLGLVTPKWGLKDGDIGDKVNGKVEKIYNPSFATKAAGEIGAFLIDTATTGGFGGVGASTARSAVKWTAFDLGTRAVVSIKEENRWKNEEDTQKDSKDIFGDENAIYKIQSGSTGYRKNGTEFINNINSVLSRKIKTPPLSIAEKTRKESNALLIDHKGDSARLLNTIKTSFSRQAIPFNVNSHVPAWMLNNSAKQNRAMAASFYAIAKEMSKDGKEWMKCGGKKMSFKEISQRAYDYARAATVVEKIHSRQQAHSGFSTSSKQALDEFDANMAKLNAAVEESSAKSRQTSSPSSQGQTAPQQSQSQQSAVSSSPQVSGWGNALEQLGMTGFSDVTKNMGYVLAMLPDMLIGMFTGKNPSMKLGDNLMPLAAIFGGLFVKNPLLKMLLLGFGGANLFNNAGQAAISQGRSKAVQATSYKSYPDEPLNKRIVNPAMKGSSMIATIDGKPVVITISDTAVNAYERGNVPLNTLANAVLRKYDENNALASRNYDLQHQQEEKLNQQRGLK